MHLHTAVKLSVQCCSDHTKCVKDNFILINVGKRIRVCNKMQRYDAIGTDVHQLPDCSLSSLNLSNKHTLA